MAEDLILQYATLLKQQYLFRGLSEADIAYVVSRLEAITYQKDQVIYRQGSAGDSFYVIFRGRVNETRRQRQRERLVDKLGPGDYFGEEALLFDRLRSATITALEPLEVLRLDRETFFELLKKFPFMRKNLSATAESRHLALRENFSWLGDDEVIYLISRKHEFFLLRALILPVILGVGSIPVLSFGLAGTGSLLMSNTAIAAGSLGLVASVLWGIWNWVDWGNDYYIVTNQRVLWLERVVALYNSRREAPLTQVLAVNVTRSWLGRILGYGNMDVRTFTGGILMRNAENPTLFSGFVEGFKQRAVEISRDAEKEAMKQALRLRFGLDKPKAAPPPAPKPAENLKPNRKVKPGSLQEKLQTFLQVRYERDGVVTYRKHWLLLLRKTWAPTILILLLVVMIVYIVLENIAGRPTLFSETLWYLLIGVVSLGVLTWWLYNYVDWSNDIYQLSADQIRDIERKPLGEEKKLTAPLESILSLEHTRENIIQLLFNYGNVIINVGQTKFIFRGVYHPDQVHQDVSDYTEALKRRKLEAEAARGREQMLDWLTTYRSQEKILEEIENGSVWKQFEGKI